MIDLFNFDKKNFKFTKPIRLIELFAGYGSQALACKYLGMEFEHYRICEFDRYAVQSYNEIHNTNFATSDITKITADDLGIVEIDKYDYLMTYSFPCTDLSLAGAGKGMEKGSGTRSGLLWEVERLLEECDELPQVLLMENVTQVCGKKNWEHFRSWLDKLESLGYRNYYQNMIATEYGVDGYDPIPQTRDRTFMVSVLGNYQYEFPKKMELKLRLKDFLEDNVDENYLNDEKVVNGFQRKKVFDHHFNMTNVKGDIDDIFNYNNVPKVLGGIGEKKSNGGTQWYNQDRIYDDNISPAIATTAHPYHAITKTSKDRIENNIVKKDTIKTLTANGMQSFTTDNCHSIKTTDLRIRKLTPRECFRLMGVKDEDSDKLTCSNAQKYKQAGNSICTNVLMAIIKEMI